MIRSIWAGPYYKSKTRWYPQKIRVLKFGDFRESERNRDRNQRVWKIEYFLRMESGGAAAADDSVERVEDSKDLQQQSKALDKLTDHVEDRQLDSSRVHQVWVLFSWNSDLDMTCGD